MWLVKAGTKMEVFAPFGRIGAANSQSYAEASQTIYMDHGPWKAYTSKEDKIYEKEEVWDYVAVMNGRTDIPMWAKHNIKEFRKVVIKVKNSKGKDCYAMLRPEQIQYLD